MDFSSIFDFFPKCLFSMGICESEKQFCNTNSKHNSVKRQFRTRRSELPLIMQCGIILAINRKLRAANAVIFLGTAVCCIFALFSYRYTTNFDDFQISGVCVLLFVEFLSGSYIKMQHLHCTFSCNTKIWNMYVVFRI